MQNSLESVYETLSFSCLPDGWYYSPVTNNEIQCFQITRQPANLPPVIISRLILIQNLLFADGASANRRFFRLHSIDEYKKSGVTYLAPNVCRAPGDKVYFIADPPHLLKTIRNEWYNSQSKKTHHLIVSHVLIIVL